MPHCLVPGYGARRTKVVLVWVGLAARLCIPDVVYWGLGSAFLADSEYINQ